MSITNRSRYFVTVKRRADLRREFPFAEFTAAVTYSNTLKTEGHEPEIGQLEDAIEIRIRQKGFPTFNRTVQSILEAEDVVCRIKSERRQGLFRDYTKAHRVTFLDLIKRYMIEEGPKNKGWIKVEQYKCRGWLEDANAPGIESEEWAKKQTRNIMRKRATGLEWMHKPFAQVETADIDGYIRDRCDVVGPATVDREIDVMSRICTIAIERWKYRVDESPMEGVCRPRYFNERNRRLKSGEETRLLDAAYKEDTRRSIAVRLEELLQETRGRKPEPASTYGRKRLVRDLRKELLTRAEADCQHVPLCETLIAFQLQTAARRGEALNLLWENVDFGRRSAYLPETKNGQPRELPLRSDLIELMQRLPKNNERVFPITEEALKGAWSRIVAEADALDLHLHDLRHEGISRVAETGKFGLVDLQAFSGHRDVRMLMRYSHLCTTKLAERLDEAFGGDTASTDNVISHRGRRRLAPKAGIKIADISADHDVPAAEHAYRPDNVIPLFGAA